VPSNRNALPIATMHLPASSSLGFIRLGFNSSTLTTTSAPNSANQDNNNMNPTSNSVLPPSPLSGLKLLWARYGVVFLSTYFGIYCITIGTMYKLVSANILSADNAIDMLNYVHLDKVINFSAMDPRAGNLAVAWILTKLTEPLRFVLAASICPKIARAVGRAPMK